MNDLRGIEFFKRKNRQYIVDALTKALIKSEVLGYIKELIDKNEPFSIYFMDIDYFKVINDTYGHHVGDNVLMSIANAINSTLDDNSVLGRFGGDEFIVVQKGVTDYDTKWQLARKICLSVSNLEYDFGQEHLNQTTSITIGISSFPDDANNFNDLIITADKALYRGKQKGRNCFIIYDKAKHEKLKIDSDSQNNLSKQLELIYDKFSNVFNLDVDKTLTDLVTELAPLYSIDRVCIKLDDRFDVLYKNDDMKGECYPIPIEKYNEVGYKNNMILAINFRTHYEQSDPEFFKMLEDNNSNSQMVIRIKTHSNKYGYLRLDKFREMIWNSDVKIIFQTLASLYGIGLERGNK